MIHGDDDYPPGHPLGRLFFEITDADRPPMPRPAELPTSQIQARIAQLRDQRGFGSERIEAHMRRIDGVTVPVDTIRWILNQPQ